MQIKPWTVLIYTSATPDLQKPILESLQETAQGAHDQVEVVAQLGQDQSSQRLRLHQGQLTPLAESVPTDMAAPSSLHDFVRWGMQKFPAQRYAVVLGGHGSGLGGAITDSARQKMMRLPQLAGALEGLPSPIEVLVFNTCLAAQAEVVTELGESAKEMVASQGGLFGLGLPLAPWLSQLHTTSQPAASLVEMAAQVPERAPATSALHLQGAARLKGTLDEWALEARQRPELRDRLREVVQQQPTPWHRPEDRPLSDQLDLGRFLSDLLEHPLPESLRERTQQLQQAARELVQAKSQEAWTGLSIYLPSKRMPFVDTFYPQLKLSQGEWDEFLDWLNSK